MLCGANASSLRPCRVVHNPRASGLQVLSTYTCTDPIIVFTCGSKPIVLLTCFTDCCGLQPKVL